jgi:hypothetical protein
MIVLVQRAGGRLTIDEEELIRLDRDLTLNSAYDPMMRRFVFTVTSGATVQGELAAPEQGVIEA